MTLFPFQDGKALPSSHPASCPSQVTFQSPFLNGTPTMGMLIVSDGTSIEIPPVCIYSSRGRLRRSVTLFGANPVSGSEDIPPLLLVVICRDAEAALLNTRSVAELL